MLAAVGGRELTAFEVVPHVSASRSPEQNTQWLLSMTLCYLTHLEAIGEVRRIPGEPERWTA